MKFRGWARSLFDQLCLWGGELSEINWWPQQIVWLCIPTYVSEETINYMRLQTLNLYKLALWVFLSVLNKYWMLGYYICGMKERRTTENRDWKKGWEHQLDELKYVMGKAKIGNRAIGSWMMNKSKNISIGNKLREKGAFAKSGVRVIWGRDALSW